MLAVDRMVLFRKASRQDSTPDSLSAASSIGLARSISSPDGLSQSRPRPAGPDWRLPEILSENKQLRKDSRKISGELDAMKKRLKEVSLRTTRRVIDTQGRNKRLVDDLDTFSKLHQNDVDSLNQSIRKVKENEKMRNEGRADYLREEVKKVKERLSEMEVEQQQQPPPARLSAMTCLLGVRLVDVFLSIVQTFFVMLTSIIHAAQAILSSPFAMVLIPLSIFAAAYISKNWGKMWGVVGFLPKTEKNVHL